MVASTFVEVFDATRIFGPLAIAFSVAVVASLGVLILSRLVR